MNDLQKSSACLKQPRSSFSNSSGPAQRVFRWSGVLALIVIALFTLSPPEWRPDTGLPGALEHLLAAFIAGFLLGVGFGHWFIATTVTVLAVFAVLEAAQVLVPGRHANFTHLEVKMAGAVLGLVAGWTFVKLAEMRSGWSG